MPETYFQSQVIQLARLFGWYVNHTRAVEMRAGYWRTPVTGMAGFPDLVLAKAPTERNRGGVIFAELKTATGKTSETQKEWLERLSLGGAEIYIWRPQDLDDIRKRLEGTK
jgi:hypothetical protein